jgi:mannose-6-phosphate isomerase-like protein (cupin superfamily)
MDSAREIKGGYPIDLGEEVVGLEQVGGRAWLMARTDHGPPRIDGYTVGAPFMTADAPHNGEMHPDGDELLYLVSGAIQVWLELDGGDRTVDVEPGQAVVVPRGVWHRVLLKEPSRLVHITPGPGGDHRPLPAEE